MSFISGRRDDSSQRERERSRPLIANVLTGFVDVGRWATERPFEASDEGECGDQHFVVFFGYDVVSSSSNINPIQYKLVRMKRVSYDIIVFVVVVVVEAFDLLV